MSLRFSNGQGDVRRATPKQRLQAALAIVEIFILFLKPDLIMYAASIEQLKLIIEPLKPIFSKVTADLSDIQCILLSSTRLAFTDSMTLDLQKWALHKFAIISNDRDESVQHGMRLRYHGSVRALHIADVILQFDTLVGGLQQEIQRLADVKGYTFKVFEAFSALAIQVQTEEELVLYYLTQTASFCDACLNDRESNFDRPLLRLWFMRDGAQQVDDCINILKYMKVHNAYYDLDVASKLIKIIYYGFKVQDMLPDAKSDLYALPRNRGDCRQPQKNRRKFYNCVRDLDAIPHLRTYISYAEKQCAEPQIAE